MFKFMSEKELRSDDRVSAVTESSVTPMNRAQPSANLPDVNLAVDSSLTQVTSAVWVSAELLSSKVKIDEPH